MTKRVNSRGLLVWYLRIGLGTPPVTAWESQARGAKGIGVMVVEWRMYECGSGDPNSTKDQEKKPVETRLDTGTRVIWRSHKRDLGSQLC